MIQWGAVICDISFFGNILSSVTKKGTNITRSLGKQFVDKQIDKFNIEYKTGEGSGSSLTNNEMQDIIKVIKPLENRGI